MHLVAKRRHRDDAPCPRYRPWRRKPSRQADILGARLACLSACSCRARAPAARIDPTRIVEGVVGGIGFLGAGSIIRSGGSIQGITTGAAIWIAGAIGVACATGNVILAALVCGLALIIVYIMGWVNARIAAGSNEGSPMRR